MKKQFLRFLCAKFHTNANLVKTYVAELTSAEGCVELWPTTYAIYIYIYIYTCIYFFFFH